MHVSSCHWKEILNRNIVETIGIFSFVCKCLNLISYSIDAERLIYFIHIDIAINISNEILCDQLYVNIPAFCFTNHVTRH